jgi:membrane fusion protein, multidrug efflux system
MGKKKWLLGGFALLAVAGATTGVAVKMGWLPMPGSTAVAATDNKDSKDSKDKDGKKPEVPLEFLASEVVQATLATLPDTVEFSGPLVAPQTAVLRAKTGGTLLSLGVAEGDRVRAGQVLGRIEQAELGSRVAERSAQVESARASLVQAERTHAGNERLAAQQFISAIALENSRATLDTTRAAVAAAQASLDSTRVGLRDATLLAPIAGTVAKRHVLAGEKISPEQQVLTLVDLTRLELAGSVGTHQVSRLRAGLPVQVQVEGQPQPVLGKLARIAPAADAGTRSIAVTVDLANPKVNDQELLRAGQYAVARVDLADNTQRLTLPMSAVSKTSGQDYVWVIEKGPAVETVLARKAVTLGRRDERNGRVEVLQGITAQQVALAARFDNLKEGAKALVVTTKTPLPTPAAASSAAPAAPTR